MTAQRQAEREQIARYADAIAMWRRGFDTAAIAERLAVPEPMVARWVANFRDVVRGE